MLVQLDKEAGADELKAVEAAFRRYGFDAEVEATWHRRPQTGNGPSWVIAAALGATFAQFFGGFFSAAGADAWMKLRDWVSDLYAARQQSIHGPEGGLQLTDADGTEIVVWRLPDEAFRRLLEIDWSEHLGGLLWWDEERREWTDAIDLPPAERADIDPWRWDHEGRRWIRESERQ